MVWYGLLLGVFFGLSACSGMSGQSREEKLCRAGIAADLVNPETVEFHDFSSITSAQYRIGMVNFAWREHGIASNDRGRFGSQLDAPIDSAIAEFDAKKAQYFSVRVRAETKVGNKATSKFVCALIDDECSCVDASE